MPSLRAALDACSRVVCFCCYTSSNKAESEVVHEGPLPEEGFDEEGPLLGKNAQCQYCDESEDDASEAVPHGSMAICCAKCWRLQLFTKTGDPAMTRLASCAL